jgi:hypothetical protein
MLSSIYPSIATDVTFTIKSHAHYTTPFNAASTVRFDSNSFSTTVATRPASSSVERPPVVRLDSRGHRTRDGVAPIARWLAQPAAQFFPARVATFHPLHLLLFLPPLAELLLRHLIELGVGVVVIVFLLGFSGGQEALIVPRRPIHGGPDRKQKRIRGRVTLCAGRTGKLHDADP